MSAGAPICTIITKNRAAFLRTLFDSFRKCAPEGRCVVLVIDDFEGFLDAEQLPFEILRLQDIGLDNPGEFRFKYTPFELCCALKPFLLEHLLLERGFEKAFYFDSDIMILSPLTELERLFDRSDVLLTPHLDRDLPSDGKRPDDGHMLLSGVFNGGFVGVKKSEIGLSFLRWWKNKLREGCVEDHFNGTFVDQKYLDLAVGLFEGVGVVRHPGCNVAYWNLHSRKITNEDGKWFSNGQPLVFFHFSAYDLTRPNELSGQQNRFELLDDPDLQTLFGIYRDCLVESGFATSINWTYDFGTYRNGKRIPAGARRAFLGNPAYRSMPDPFDSSTHSIGFRLAALKQSVRLLGVKLAHRFLRKAL